MKKIIFLIIALSVESHGFGKNIIDIFYMLPSETILNKNLEQRKRLVDYYLTETIKIQEKERFPSSQEKLIKTIDKANGFMEIFDGSEGSIEICYWNQNNNEKIIAINHVACAMFEGTVKLTFYKLTFDNRLEKLEIDKVVPYDDIHNKLIKNELSESDNEILKRSGILSKENIILDLPRYGKEIKVKFGWDEIDDKQKFIMRNECFLYWKNDTLTINN